jgi:GT2 family glycosyltransferase
LPGVTALSHRVGVGIATRDRWDDLALTLAHLRERGYAVLETVVIDDGSEPAMPTGFAERFPWAQFIRFEKSEGVCAQRNRLARLLTAPLILNIDDDSYPVAGDLAAACDWLEAHPAAFALSFQIMYKEETIPADYAPKAPFPVRDFMGGGALIKREVLLALGGYEDKFEFYLEEPEVCMRAMQAGYEVWGYPGVVVQHDVSPSRRDPFRRAELMLRKEVLMALMFFPFPWSYRRGLTAVPGFLYHHAEYRPYWRPMIAGAIKAWGDHFSGRFRRQRLTVAQFQQWRKVPIAPQVLDGLPSR